jgi:hypothetical protein
MLFPNPRAPQSSLQNWTSFPEADQFGAHGSQLSGGGLLCDAGNQGDGVVIWTTNVALRNFNIQGAGPDNLRIGGYAPTDPFYVPNQQVNANCWLLDGVESSYAGHDGVVVSDEKGGAIDANAGFASRLSVRNNGRHGLVCIKTYLGSTFASTLAEANGTKDATGRGIFLTADAADLLFLGGDVEANVGGQIHEVVPFSNSFRDVAVQGRRYNSRALQGAYVPGIFGGDAAGSATSMTGKGTFAVEGRSCRFGVELTWSGHSGASGQAFVTLPTVGTSYLGLRAVFGRPESLRIHMGQVF